MQRGNCTILLVLSFLLPTLAFGQSGPGGVGSSTTNVLWLSADQGVYNNAGTTLATSTQNVQQWNDRSGNGRHAMQTTVGNRPNLQTSVLNGLPALRFTAANTDRMMSTGLSTANRASVWVVARYSSLPSPNPGLIQGAATGNAYSSTPAQKNMGMWVSSSTSQVWGRGIQSDGTQRNVTMATSLSSGQAYVLNTMYRQTAISQYVDHGAAGSVATNGTLSSWTDMAIGCQAGTEGWNGDIAEVVAYNVDVNEAQRVIIANYLSAKYGTTLTANDVYREDNVGRGNFDHEVAGIGRINASNMHTDAQGSGIVRISGAAGLGDNEFLFWGHDDGALGAWGVGDVPTGLQGRLQRVWRVSERNTTGAASVDVGAVDVTFDLSGLGPVTPTHLRLLVDTDNDGVFNDETGLSGATLVSGSQYRFSGVTLLQDGRRFTLGTTDMGATPLPVELVNFNASALENGRVQVEWTTASERDNDHFVVERSADLSFWERLARVDGVGNSTVMTHYNLVDPTPVNGTGYYRLVQYDVDSTATTFPMVAVETRGLLDGHIYPNPSSGGFYLRLPLDQDEEVELQLIDATGRIVVEQHVRWNSGPLLITPPNNACGLYHLSVEARQQRQRLPVFMLKP